MRMFIFYIALLFPTLVFTQNITRQGYAGGTPTLGGCTGINANDTNSFLVGQCYTTNDGNSSLWVNDCWANGVLSATFYNGSSTCDPAFASQLTVDIASNANGNTNASQAYCNLDQNPVAYDTFTCSAPTTPQSNLVVRAYAYAAALGNTNCSGTYTTSYDIPVGVCTLLPTAQTPPVYAMANCANGLVTTVFYNTSNCSVAFDVTGAVTSGPTPFGPYAQINATSATSISLGAAGSTCANYSGLAYLAYSCVNVTATPSSSSSSSTGATPPTNGTSSSSSSTGPTNNPTNGTSSSSTGPTGPNVNGTSTGGSATTAPPSNNTQTTSPPTKSDAAVVTTGFAAIIILILAQFA